MNPDIKTEFGVILDSLNKIRAILVKEPKVKLILWSAYYCIKIIVWLIKLIK